MSRDSDMSLNHEVVSTKPKKTRKMYDEDFSDVTESQVTTPEHVQKKETEESEEERVPKEKIMKNRNIFDQDVPSLTTKKSIDVYTQQANRRKKSLEIYGEDGPIVKVKKRPEDENVSSVKTKKSDDTDDSGKVKESQEVHGSEDGFRNENRKRTYVVPKTKVRQSSSEKQESSVELLPLRENPESSDSVATPVQPVQPVRPLNSTPRSEGSVAVKRKRNACPSKSKTPSPRKKNELSCHSRTHLRLDPEWISPKATDREIAYQKQRRRHSRDAKKRRHPSHRRKRRAKTASDIIKLRVNGNRVTPLTKSPSTTSQSSGKASISTERALASKKTSSEASQLSSRASRSAERALKSRASSTSRSSLKAKGTNIEKTVMLDSATQTSLRFSLPKSTAIDEAESPKEAPKKKKGWFARCCGRS